MREDDSPRLFEGPFGETLFDDVQSALMQGHLDTLLADTRHRRDRAKRWGEQLALAQRYVLSDEAYRRINAFGLDHPLLVIDSLPLARPPFSPMWLEWLGRDEEPAGTGEATNRCGVLLERISVDRPIYAGYHTSFAWFDDDRMSRNVAIGFLEYVFDLGDEPSFDDDQRARWQTEIVGLLLRSRNVMTAEEGDKLLTAARLGGGDKAIAGWLHDIGIYMAWHPRMFIRLNRPTQAELERLKADHGRADDLDRTFGQLVVQALYTQAGTQRLVATALTLLAQRSLLQPSAPRERQGSRPSGNRQAPFMAYREIKVALPRGWSTGAVRRKFATFLEGLPRRRHLVEGHWCHDRVAKQPCAHQWQTVVPDQRYRCAVCNGRRWRVEAHARGDASRGWVSQRRTVQRRDGTILEAGELP